MSRVDILARSNPGEKHSCTAKCWLCLPLGTLFGNAYFDSFLFQLNEISGKGTGKDVDNKKGSGVSQVQLEHLLLLNDLNVDIGEPSVFFHV